MPDFVDEDLSEARFDDVTLTGAQLRHCDLTVAHVDVVDGQVEA